MLTGSAPVPIQLALIRTRTVKNAGAYWQVTVPPRLAGLRAWFEACTNLVAVWWQIGDAVGWETADDALKNIPSSSSAG